MRTLSKSHKKLQCTKKEEKNKQFVYLECQKGVCSIRTWEVKKKKKEKIKRIWMVSRIIRMEKEGCSWAEDSECITEKQGGAIVFWDKVQLYENDTPEKRTVCDLRDGYWKRMSEGPDLEVLFQKREGMRTRYKWKEEKGGDRVTLEADITSKFHGQNISLY